AGTYTITVTASDGLSSTSATATATITRQEPNLPAIPKPIQPTKPDPPVLLADLNVPKPPLLEPIRPGQLGLRFSEVFADPEGLDAGVEYLELFHAGAEALSTAGWSVTNLKRAFALPQTSLEPGDYLVIQGAALGLQLRNLGDTLYLVSPDGAIRDGVKYPKAKTGQSFSRFTKRWAWTEASAGEDNVKPEGKSQESRITNQGAGEQSLLRIDEARLTEAGQKFALEGTVVVAMGALDERQILLGDASGTMVIGFDQSVDLAVGDRIRVAVRRSTAKEPRALAKVADLERRGRGGLVEPVAATIESLSDDNLGALVAVEGVVTVTRATSFTLDDETGQLSVQWAGASDLERDARVAVTGVVRSSSGRLRLIGVEVVEVVEESAPLVAGATVEAPAAAPAPTVPVPTAASTPSPLGFVLMGFAGLLIVVRLLVLPRLA
ncbi:MAG: lamin tail domain-containing protein, partial [Candidatus Kerfeldbacteria bacterium]|nr:lamin tail domain-containing protein [Candidatus Kerfeldbacteria bacterium]